MAHAEPASPKAALLRRRLTKMLGLPHAASQARIVAEVTRLVALRGKTTAGSRNLDGELAALLALQLTGRKLPTPDGVQQREVPAGVASLGRPASCDLGLHEVMLALQGAVRAD